MSTRTLTLRLHRPHAGQQQLAREERRFNVASNGRRWGKTEWGLNRALLGAVPGQPVGWFSPTYRMLSEVWRDALRLTRDIGRPHVQDRRIDLVGGGLIDFWSLDTPDVARGRKYRRVIIDEAGMVPGLEEAWHAVIRPTLTDLAGDAWFLSTPRGFNFFHTLYQRGQSADYPEWASWQMPTSANPFLPAGEIEQARLELPERVFRQEYLALFEDDAQTIFSPTWWAAGRNRYDPADEALTNRCWARILSWDTAFKESEDAAYTALVVADVLPPPDYRLLVRDVWRDRVPFPALVSAVQRALARWDADGKLHGCLIEDRASGISLVQTLRDLLPGAPIVAQAPLAGKTTRAELAALLCQDSLVLLPQAAPWLRDFEAELYAAPHTAFWDQVDAFAQLVLYWEPHLVLSTARQRLEAAA